MAESIKQLSAGELTKILDQTKAELKRRENAKKAKKEILDILKKYRISVEDLILLVKVDNRNSNRKSLGARKLSRLSLNPMQKKTTLAKTKATIKPEKKEANKKNK